MQLKWQTRFLHGSTDRFRLFKRGKSNHCRILLSRKVLKYRENSRGWHHQEAKLKGKGNRGIDRQRQPLSLLLGGENENVRTMWDDKSIPYKKLLLVVRTRSILDFWGRYRNVRVIKIQSNGSMSAGPPLWSKLKCLNNYWMDWEEVW